MEKTKEDLLKDGQSRQLKDEKSAKNSYMPIRAAGDDIIITEPDGGIIPAIEGQKKCDFMLRSSKYCQTMFVELKGANISIESDYNPFDQIIMTIDFFKSHDRYNAWVNAASEKHAFIVSPGRQKLPRGVERKERALWQKLVRPRQKSQINDLVHYVKVTKSDKYSDKNGQIICSPKYPVEMPYR